MNLEREQNSVRVGIVQIAPILMDKNACVVKALKYIEEAKSMLALSSSMHK